MSSVNWRNYVDEQGDFALPNYLFKVNTDLMKQALDLGTLLSEDKSKLRAYKEQIKKVFKKRWTEIAEVLEHFDLITPCMCDSRDYCSICGGSRYNLNYGLSPNKMREIGYVIGIGQNEEIADKLHKGLVKALEELEHYENMP